MVKPFIYRCFVYSVQFLCMLLIIVGKVHVNQSSINQFISGNVAHTNKKQHTHTGKYRKTKVQY